MHDGNRSNFRDRCHIVFCQFSFDYHLGNVEMTKEITKGSIADIMQNSNVSLAESFLSCDCVVLFDVSGSMNSLDGHLKSRFERGLDELRDIQASMPGKFAIIQFADRVDFMPGGVPSMGISGSGTDLTAALKYAKVADEIPDMRFVIISDGGSGAWFDGEFFAAPKVDVADTTAAGDTLLAEYCWRTFGEILSAPEAARWAVAAGSAACTMPGGAPPPADLVAALAKAST